MRPVPTAASISGDVTGSPFCCVSAAAAAAIAAVADAFGCPPDRDTDRGPIASISNQIVISFGCQFAHVSSLSVCLIVCLSSYLSV